MVTDCYGRRRERRRTRKYGGGTVIDRIKNAARGRWIDILSHFGIDRSILDGKHHPCPKCGGTDRFRLIDADEGAVLCNQYYKRSISLCGAKIFQKPKPN
ncbi:MAG: hypothetical protein IH899_15805 [Planctomycetes bacterium]|nr:hypothetical protein [Planctomycetota bacterium]